MALKGNAITFVINCVRQRKKKKKYYYYKYSDYYVSSYLCSVFIFYYIPKRQSKLKKK